MGSSINCDYPSTVGNCTLSSLSSLSTGIKVKQSLTKVILYKFGISHRTILFTLLVDIEQAENRKGAMYSKNFQQRIKLGIVQAGCCLLQIVTG
ncbi:hypothetical protein S83_053889 [Arachis hypogaea]